MPSAPTRADRTKGPSAVRARDLNVSALRLAAYRSWRQFWNNQCVDLAGALTYYGVLGTFPALIAVVSLLGTVGQGQQAVTAVIEVANRAAPPLISDLVESILRSLAGSRSGWGVAIGTVGALYAVSRYTRSLGRALNRIYGVKEGRPVVFLELRMLLVTTVLGALVLAVTALVVISGPIAEVVGQIAGVGPTAIFVWGLLKWPAALLVAALIVAVLYATTPNVRRPQWRWISVGALLAIVIWAIVSTAFGLYVANVSRFDATYGSLAGAVVFLIWLWVTNLAVLIGALVDCELERIRELESGLDAFDQLHLELRDTRRIEKLAGKDERSRQHAERIRVAGVRGGSKVRRGGPRSGPGSGSMSGPGRLLGRLLRRFSRR